MSQQTAVEHRRNRSTFLKRLSAGQTEKKDLSEITRHLGEDYAAFYRIAADLSWHSKWIPYPFLTERLKKIADEMRAQGELFRAKLTEIGGIVPQITSQSHEDAGFRQNVRQLVKDMEEHAAQSEMLVHQRNTINDAGVVRLLDTVASEMQKQKDELLDIVMRLS